MDELYEKIYAALDGYDYATAEKYINKLSLYDRVEGAKLTVSLYIEQGNAAAARAAWQKLFAMLPTDFYTQFLYARILFMEKRYVSAFHKLQGIRIPQDKLRGYGERIANLRGQCCRLLGNTQEAAAAYKKAADLADEPRLKALEYSNYLFNLHYFGSHQADFLRQAAAGFNTALGNLEVFVHDSGRQKQFPLRIGYIGGFSPPCTALFFVCPAYRI